MEDSIYKKEAKVFEEIMKRLVPILVEHHKQNGYPETKVVEIKKPKELEEIIDFKVDENGHELSEIICLIK